MKKSILLVSLLLILVLGSSCSSKSNSFQPPNQGQEGPEPPTGEPCAEVELSWQPPTTNVDGTPLTNLASYRIYMGFQQSVFTDQIEINDPALESTIIEDLEYGRQYYMVMTAINALGEESAYSNQVVKLADSCPTFMSFSDPYAHY